MSLRIDAHQHFWRYAAPEYGWIGDDMKRLRRDFLPADLAPQLLAARIDGSIAVQARQTVAETDWLLELAAANPSIKGVVGWLPLADQGAAIASWLDRYAAFPRLRGVRHVLQAEPASYFADQGFNAALHEVSAHGLTYDLLIFAGQLPAAVALVDRHPDLRVVLDHIAKPTVQGPPPPTWRSALRDLARREHVCCKLSGVVTEAPGWNWTPELLWPYFEVVLEAFGPRRLMFGSDWPVCLVATNYDQWFRLIDDWTSPLSPAERTAILGGTATAWYHLQP